MRIGSVSGGRLRLWQLKHSRDLRNHALLCGIFLVVAAVGTLEFRDKLREARVANEQLTMKCATLQERMEDMDSFSQRFPRVTFVIEARNPEELHMRLAEIAGDLDAVRVRNRGMQ